MKTLNINGFTVALNEQAQRKLKQYIARENLTDVWLSVDNDGEIIAHAAEPSSKLEDCPLCVQFPHMYKKGYWTNMHNTIASESIQKIRPVDASIAQLAMTKLNKEDLV